jgi:hypothetical protein
MKHGDISNVSSPQVMVATDVVVKLKEEESRKLLIKKTEFKIGDIEVLSLNKLWKVSGDYGLSLELSGFSEDGWTEELLEQAFEKFERRVVNPFNYWQLYENRDEVVGLLPYRPNLKGVIDTPDKVARYGSAGVEIGNI